MVKLPPGFVDDLKARVRLSDVIGRRVKLKRQGNALVGLSPFNAEKSPSFYVHDRDGYYKCFSSGNGGDAISFLQDTERLDFIEAVERLAELAGVAMPKATPQERQEYNRNERLIQLCEAVASHFEASLRVSEGAKARAYLVNRGLSEAAWGRHRLGFAPQDSQATVAALKSSGFTEAEMADAGLCIKSDYGNGVYNRFRGRLIFPITDIRGRVIAFGGRALDPDQKPKYLNSSDSPIFHKSDVLYNYRNARTAWADVRDEHGGLIVCEGYMDVIALVEHGFGHAVAPLGTALTEGQLALVWRAGPQPIVCFDGDNAGQKAAQRVLRIALPKIEPRKSVKFALMPEGQDPDDILSAKGRGAFSTLLEAALPASEMLWQTEFAAAPLTTPEQQADLDVRLMQGADSIENKGVATAYKRVFRGKLWDAFRVGRKPRTSLDDGADAIKTGEARLPRGFGLLMRAVDSPVLIEDNFEKLSEFDWPDTLCQKVQETCLDLVLSGEILTRDTLIADLKRQNCYNVVKFIENYPFLAQKHGFDKNEDSVHDNDTWLLALEQIADFRSQSPPAFPQNSETGIDIASLQKQLGLKRKETQELKNRMRDLTSS